MEQFLPRISDRAGWNGRGAASSAWKRPLRDAAWEASRGPSEFYRVARPVAVL